MSSPTAARGLDLMGNVTRRVMHRARAVRTRTWVTALFALTVVAALGALACRDETFVPAVATVLAARSTAGFLAVESPDVWLRALDGAAHAARAADNTALALLFSPAARQAALGFDPADGAQWRAAGLDPGRGAALAWDSRAQADGWPTPLALVAAGPPERAPLRDWPWRRLASWSFAPLGGVALPGLATWSVDDGPRLAADPALRAAFADLPTGPRLAAYAHTDGIRALLRQRWNGKALAALDHVTRRLRAAALVVTPEAIGGRILLTAEGVESLRQVFNQRAPPQPFSPLLPASGLLAVRGSLNLRDLFDGALAWLPPEWLEARLAVASSRLGLLAMAGVDWTQLERAFSGQFVAALTLGEGDGGAALGASADGAAPPWLLLIGVRDPALCDAAVLRFTERSAARGKPATAIDVAGARGWQLPEPPVVLVRKDNILLVAADRAGAAKALSGSGGRLVRAEAAAALDGEVVLGAVLQPPTGAASGKRWQDLIAAAPPMALRVVGDARGLALQVPGLQLGAWLQVFAAAVPAVPPKRAPP